jgi:hypothetical protein
LEQVSGLLMTDITTAATVTRSLLSMADLSINDHTNYVVAGPAIMAGSVQWDRKQVSAPWVDGDVTVARRRTNVMEPLSVYVAGTDHAGMMTNLRTLRDAFVQDRYTLAFTINSEMIAWDCEAADYSVLFDTAHVHARYCVATFQIPRKPVPLAGGF